MTRAPRNSYLGYRRSHYLKYLENESDESVVENFCENPYWQNFFGLEAFHHSLPCHPTILVKWGK